MGAQVVIAVNVGTPLLDREELQSVSGVLVQSIAVMTLANDQHALAFLPELISASTALWLTLGIGLCGVVGARFNRHAALPDSVKLH